MFDLQPFLPGERHRLNPLVSHRQRRPGEERKVARLETQVPENARNGTGCGRFQMLHSIHSSYWATKS